MQPTLIADHACHTGENPLWHPDERKVYWTDIPAGTIFRYDPATGQHEVCYDGDVVGGFTLQADGALLLFMARGAVKTWRDGAMATLLDEIPDEVDNRFNDVIADPAGRVYCGVMSTPTRAGRLYRLDPDGTLTVMIEDVGTANGMGFTLDRRHMYFTDSRRGEISLFDYDQATGDLMNRRLFVKVPEGGGHPDGMTVDAEGCVWSARWDGGEMVRHAPDGSVDRRVAFPAKKVSSLIFGGDDYTDIYVTTAGGQNKPEEGEGAGALFHLNAGIAGLPEFRSRIGL